MTTPSALQAEALVVHLFVAVNGAQPEADRRYLLDVWQACADALGMTAPLPVDGLGTEPPVGWESVPQRSAVLAGRMRRLDGHATPSVQEALLRREHDTFCLTVMREPSPAEGKAWTDLDDDWSGAVDGLATPPGVIGSARLYLTRLVDPGTPTPDAALSAAVRARCPADPKAGEWWKAGVAVRSEFAVWEASAPADDRTVRRIVVVAAADQDPALSAWTWVVGDRELPRFGRYLLHAAKLRYQRRVWGEAEGRFRQARQETDATIGNLLSVVARSPSGRERPAREPGQAELVQASRDVVSLQAGELGLVQTATSLREMRRTVEIATANLTALSGDDELGGLFANDRELGAWFAQQLDDDATYLDATGRPRSRA